jgi:hypothetical protein
MAKNRFHYWGVYDDGKLASARGSKQFAEGTAAVVSSPETGSGLRVCILKAPASGGLGAPTGVCYISGTRKKERKRKKKT